MNIQQAEDACANKMPIHQEYINYHHDIFIEHITSTLSCGESENESIEYFANLSDGTQANIKHIYV